MYVFVLPAMTNLLFSMSAFAQVADKLGHRASLSWIKQLLPLLQATKGIQQVPSTAHLYSNWRFWLAFINRSHLSLPNAALFHIFGAVYFAHPL